jgi:hypothetical protein
MQNKNINNTISINMTKVNDLIHESCISLIIEPSKTRKDHFTKLILENAIGYISYSELNPILSKMGFGKGYIYKDSVYCKYGSNWKYENIKLIYEYYSIKFKKRSMSLYHDLPKGWFSNLFSKYLLEYNHFYEFSIVDFLKQELKERNSRGILLK